MTHDEIIQQLIWAGRVLVAEGQDDFTRGHISFRLPDDPSRFFMKAHSLGLDEITPENVLTIDLDGKVVAGSARRHSEVYIHSEIFKVRPDVNCVIHTHPPYAVALSATGRPMRGYSQPSALFYEALGVYTDTINLIRSTEMGAGVGAASRGAVEESRRRRGWREHRGDRRQCDHVGKCSNDTDGRRGDRHSGARIPARRH